MENEGRLLGNITISKKDGAATLSVNDWENETRENRKSLHIEDLPPFVARLIGGRIRDRRKLVMIDYSQYPVEVSGANQGEVEKVAVVVSGFVHCTAKLVTKD